MIFISLKFYMDLKRSQMQLFHIHISQQIHVFLFMSYFSIYTQRYFATYVFPIVFAAYWNVNICFFIYSLPLLNDHTLHECIMMPFKFCEINDMI